MEFFFCSWDLEFLMPFKTSPVDCEYSCHCQVGTVCRGVSQLKSSFICDSLLSFLEAKCIIQPLLPCHPEEGKKIWSTSFLLEGSVAVPALMQTSQCSVWVRVLSKKPGIVVAVFSLRLPKTWSWLQISLRSSCVEEILCSWEGSAASPNCQREVRCDKNTFFYFNLLFCLLEIFLVLEDTSAWHCVTAGGIHSVVASLDAFHLLFGIWSAKGKAGASMLPLCLQRAFSGSAEPERKGKDAPTVLAPLLSPWP